MRSNRTRTVIAFIALATCGIARQPALAYQVDGTVTVHVVAMNDRVSDPATLTAERVREEWIMVYPLRQGRLHGYSAEGAVTGTWGRSHHVTFQRNGDCVLEGRDVEIPVVTRLLPVHAEPIFSFSVAGADPDPTEPVPLSVTISLPPPFDPDAEIDEVETERFCGDERVIRRSVRIRIPGIVFTLPRPLTPPFTRDLQLKETLPLRAVQHNLDGRYPPASGWEVFGTIGVDLRISNMPVAQFAVDAAEVTRGDSVAFDAAGSLGDYQEAAWHFAIADDTCATPEVLAVTNSEIIPPTAGPRRAEPIDVMRNPLSAWIDGKRVVPVRGPGMADVMGMRTPLLCSVDVRLVVAEDLIIRSVQRARIKVVPRAWSTVLSFEYFRDASGWRFTRFVADDNSVVSLRDYVAGKIIALATFELCTFGDVGSFITECVRRLLPDPSREFALGGASNPDLFQDRARISRDTTLMLVSDGANELARTYAMFPAEMRAEIVIVEDPGPFSGTYYLSSVPPRWLRAAGSTNPDWLSAETIRANEEVGLGRDYANRLRETELHEYMHIHIMNRLYEAARRAPGGSPGPLRDEDVFDPAKVLEQMTDSDPDRLIERALRVMLLGLHRASKPDYDHERMHRWRDWAAPGDTYRGDDLTAQLQSLPLSFTYFPPVGYGDGPVAREYPSSFD